MGEYREGGRNGGSARCEVGLKRFNRNEADYN
jgi:hypothetical protein